MDRALNANVMLHGIKMPMTLTRFYLVAAGAFSIIAGAAYLLAPIEMARLIGMELPTAEAVIDVRGFYGGQLIGMGVVFLLGVRMPSLVVPGLVLATASLGGTALGRIYGIIVAGSCSPLIAGLIVLEAGSAIVAVLLLRREQGAAAKPQRYSP